MVSASLPIAPASEQGGAAAGPAEGSEQAAEGEDGPEPAAAGSAAAEETPVVVGSFAFGDAVYSVEPGGATVALCAIDPRSRAEYPHGIYVVPTAVSDGSGSLYDVARVSDGAFASADETLAAVYLPGTVSEVGADAFTGCAGLTALWVSPENPSFASYDGCLYTADLTRLLSIPEGRQEGVRIPAATSEVDPDVVSHCASVTSLTVDADSPILSSEDVLYNANGEAVEVLAADPDAEDVEDAPTVLEGMTLEVGQSVELPAVVEVDHAPIFFSASICAVDGDIVQGISSGETDVLLMVADVVVRNRFISILPIRVAYPEHLKETVPLEQELPSEQSLNTVDVLTVGERTSQMASNEKAVGSAFIMHDLEFFGDVGASDYETAMNRAIDRERSLKAGDRIWNTIYNVIFDKGRVIILGANGNYYPFGLTTEGGVGGVQYSYSKEENAARYDVPCGPYGICPTQDFYVWIYGEDQYAAKGFAGTGFDYYWNNGAADYATALSRDLSDHSSTVAAKAEIWHDFDLVIFDQGRLIVRNPKSKYYYPFGLSAEGGVGRVQYAYSFDGVRFDVPCGPNGFRPNANIYIWVYSDATAISKAYVAMDFDGYGNVGGFDYETALTRDLSTQKCTVEAGKQMWNTIYRVVFTGSRLLCLGANQKYYPFGLTTTGGIGRVQYSYSMAEDAVRYDAPCGPDGFCPTGNFYLWIYEATGFESQIVVWKGNGGSWASGADQQMSDVKVTSVGMTGPSSGLPSRAGMVFNGWAKGQTAIVGDAEVVPTGFTTYYATWRYFAIELDKAGGNEGDIGPLYYKGGTSALFSDSVCTSAKTTVVVPALRGFVFLGYFTSSIGGELLIDRDGVVQGDIGVSRWSADATIYAQWKEGEHAVSFSAGDGTPEPSWNPPAGNLRYESDVFAAPAADDISRRGFVLAGWSTSASPSYADSVATGEGTVVQGGSTTVKDLYASSSTIPSTVTLYPVWRVDVFSIALSPDGGIYDATALTAALAGDSSGKAGLSDNVVTYTVLTPAFTVPSASKTGWSFDGWSAAGDDARALAVAVNPADSSFELRDYAYVANWSMNDYLIRYLEEPVGGEASWMVGTSVTASFDVEGPTSMTIPDPVRVGYTFTGWSGPGLSGEANKGGVAVDLRALITDSLPKAPAVSLTYVAHWTQDSYTVTYVLNDADDNYVGEFAADYLGFNGTPLQKQSDGTYADSYRYDETQQSDLLMLPNKTDGKFDLARSGYVFAGWTDVVTGLSATSIDPTTQAEDLTFKAIWTPIASVELPAATTPETVEFMLDRATGKTQESAEGAERHGLTVRSTTPVDCELSVASTAGSFDAAELFEVLDSAEAGAIDELLAALGFVFAADGSGLVGGTTGQLAFLAAGSPVGALRVQGSEQFAPAGSTALRPVDVGGTLSLAQRQSDGSFADLQVDTSQVRIKSMEELEAFGSPLNLANIVWTVSIP